MKRRGINHGHDNNDYTLITNLEGDILMIVTTHQAYYCNYVNQVLYFELECDESSKEEIKRALFLRLLWRWSVEEGKYSQIRRKSFNLFLWICRRTTWNLKLVAGSSLKRKVFHAGVGVISSHLLALVTMFCIPSSFQKTLHNFFFTSFTHQRSRKSNRICSLIQLTWSSFLKKNNGFKVHL